MGSTMGTAPEPFINAHQHVTHSHAVMAVEVALSACENRPSSSNQLADLADAIAVPVPREDHVLALDDVQHALGVERRPHLERLPVQLAGRSGRGQEERGAGSERQQGAQTRREESGGRLAQGTSSAPSLPHCGRAANRRPSTARARPFCGKPTPGPLAFPPPRAPAAASRRGSR